MLARQRTVLLSAKTKAAVSTLMDGITERWAGLTMSIASGAFLLLTERLLVSTPSRVSLKLTNVNSPNVEDVDDGTDQDLKTHSVPDSSHLRNKTACVRLPIQWLLTVQVHFSATLDFICFRRTLERTAADLLAVRSHVRERMLYENHNTYQVTLSSAVGFA